jgi:hypothetical protein
VRDNGGKPAPVQIKGVCNFVVVFQKSTRSVVARERERGSQTMKVHSLAKTDIYDDDDDDDDVLSFITALPQT